jgi:hypothetical protein
MQYVGVFNDQYGGMTYLGGVVKDAWIFGLIPETETCEGWTHAAMEMLSEKVRATWDTYGYSVSRLPDDVRERHARIHAEAIARARDLGWDPGDEDEDE